MKKYKASLIISVYDRVDFLKTILDALVYQTEQDFDIVISEDAEHDSMRDFVASYPFSNDYQHLTQPDVGWSKNKALNKAIVAAKSDWLIFIDGDCVLHPRFIEFHLQYSAERHVQGGRRVKLNDDLSAKLLAKPSMVRSMTRRLLPYLIANRGCGFIEEMFFIDPKGLFGFISQKRGINFLLGSNMSLSREVLEVINGFDEDYKLPAFGEDGDILWRLKAMGYKIYSLRNLAIEYHLDHKASFENHYKNMEIAKGKMSRGEYVCKNGLKKLK